jgi:hypothetical protein
VHQPPPVHQVLEGPAFVICNFVPRKVDYHPLAVPVPYYHSNVDSDEVMFYVAGDYEARKGSGIGRGSVSLHPGGHSHGRSRARSSRAWAPRRSTSWPSWSTRSARSSSARAARPSTTGSTRGAGPGGGRPRARGRRQPGPLGGGTAEQAGVGPRPAEVQVGVLLPGEADAAEQLDGPAGANV